MLGSNGAVYSACVGACVPGGWREDWGCCVVLTPKRLWLPLIEYSCVFFSNTCGTDRCRRGHPSIHASRVSPGKTFKGIVGFLFGCRSLHAAWRLLNGRQQLTDSLTRPSIFTLKSGKRKFCRTKQYTTPHIEVTVAAKQVSLTQMISRAALSISHPDAARTQETPPLLT